ncbi:SGNH/GDSL hydrolase family protein [Streptomyces sp. CB02923]|uniref:SGNH/GDSL hydrolase family protein n=1 Tax=Streptomyces sp. CB02923 TaxID=1718985 RepID=UPI001F5B99E7|nr:SGNH/GDSL hydrolase family protein [Streptomyces sp. CB02923]
MTRRSGVALLAAAALAALPVLGTERDAAAVTASAPTAGAAAVAAGAGEGTGTGTGEGSAGGSGAGLSSGLGSAHGTGDLGNGRSGSGERSPGNDRGSTQRWRGGWAASAQAPHGRVPNWSTKGFTDQTVRQVVRVTTGGAKARIELSNRYGRTPLTVTGATIARAGKGASVQDGTVRNLLFGRQRSVTVPAGGEVRSDGLPMKVTALEKLAVTLYLAGPTGPSTFHQSAYVTTYRAAGDHRADIGSAAFTEQSQSWYYLSGVEVAGGKGDACRGAVVAFGDSITDGYGSTAEAYRRYPDVLAERFAATGHPRSVLNQGIGGNRITADSTWAGEKGVARFRHDVLGEPNVGSVIVLEGINDIGASASPDWPGGPAPDVSVAELVKGHRAMIKQAHEAGVKAIGATLPPFEGAAYYSERGEAKRDALNEWIRTSGEYDEVVDLDRALSDPADRDRLAPAYDSGDHLHPSDAGYRAMAEAVDLDEL